MTAVPGEAPAAGVRVAVTAMYAVTGVLCGIFTARFPALVDRFDIAPEELSAVLFVWALCAAFATLVIRRTITRFGSGVVLTRACWSGPWWSAQSRPSARCVAASARQSSYSGW